MAPKKFLRAQTWMVFKEAFTTYLGTTCNCNHTPLRYIICDAVILEAAVYVDDRERVSAITPLHGDRYQRDLMSFWYILKPLVLEGASWHYIVRFDRTNNGHRAWQAIFRILMERAR
jgi:hypothetical protein